MKNAKTVKKSAETPAAVNDHQWKSKLHNWSHQFDHLMIGDPGVDVIYLDEHDGWLQWDLAVRLLDSKKYT